MSNDAHPRGGSGAVPPLPSDGACEVPPANPITLTVPRPDHQRATNLYVDVPFQQPPPSRRCDFLLSSPVASGPPSHLFYPQVHGGSTWRANSPSRVQKKSKTTETPHHHVDAQSSLQKAKRGSPNPIASQPRPIISFSKTRPDRDSSIICESCGRCRCEACCSPPQRRTSKWFLLGRVSPSEAVDLASCLCCVKGVLYHCGGGAGGRERGPPASSSSTTSDEVERPCSCGGNDVWLRWTCLSLSVIPLPCLVCYWPLRGLCALLEKTYERFSTHGCRCNSYPEEANHHPRDASSRSGTLPPSSKKRLLHDCA